MNHAVMTDIVLAHHFVSPPDWVGDDYVLARDHHGIVYVLEGRAEYRLADGRCLQVEAGDCLYVPRGTCYVTCCGPDAPFVHMTVNFAMQGESTLFSGLMKRRLAQPRRFEQAFAGLVRAWAVRHPYYREKCLGLLYELVYLLECEVQAAPRQHLQRLAPARAYLDEHFCEDFPLSLLPGLCGLSATYFRRLFHSVFHETPAEYRRRLRMAQASDLLLTGQYPLEEVARRCGYPDPAYFSRMFKKTLGQAPSRYRRGGTLAPTAPDLP